MNMITQKTKDYLNKHDDTIARRDIGIFSGLVGLVSNFILFLIKFVAGWLAGSVSIMADAMNNLSDGVSSLLTIGGFYVASRPADKEHPYGHQRIEYISGLIIAIIIILVGFEFLSSSIERIVHPRPLNPSRSIVIILIISIFIKIIQGVFYKNIAITLDSNTISSLAKDSFSDFLMTTAILTSYFIETSTGLYIDGYVGFIVALFIMYSGFEAIRESTNDLIGQRPSPELIIEMTDILNKYTPLIDYHDLEVHYYGNQTIHATVDIEIDARYTLLQAHEITNDIEKDFLNELDIFLVCHLDPIDYENLELKEIHHTIKNILHGYGVGFKFHDFRFEYVNGEQSIHFEVEVPDNIDVTVENLEERILNDIEKYVKGYPFHIHFDHYYFLDDIEDFKNK